ncbi:unnamed protein product [Heligmosomoides polygyrus]|uniref:BLOC-1-related complex subunit 5 n=1 Tax=Heligmosomoides polygyrus TaxID=6339 RepID=A0A183FSC0_HELPZ|nr:unnamed protein product [Heligmosomoides polygyrus]
MSSQLRRSIGIARKHLQRTLQSCHEDLQSDIIKLLPTATNEGLIEYTELQATHHEAIAAKLPTLDNLNK